MAATDPTGDIVGTYPFKGGPTQRTTMDILFGRGPTALSTGATPGPMSRQQAMMNLMEMARQRAAQAGMTRGGPQRSAPTPTTTKVRLSAPFALDPQDALLLEGIDEMNADPTSLPPDLVEQLRQREMEIEAMRNKASRKIGIGAEAYDLQRRGLLLPGETGQLI